MGSSIYFLEHPDGPSSVLEWFRKLPTPPEEIETTKGGRVLYFRAFGPLVDGPDGKVDPDRSPVVTVFLPEVRRGVLWTVGEVHFLPTPLRSVCRPLDNVHRAFRRWMLSHELVYDFGPSAANEFDYFLEGMSKNHGAIYALPTGLAALREGRYFVWAHDTDWTLETVCRALRLRGVECTT